MPDSQQIRLSAEADDAAAEAARLQSFVEAGRAGQRTTYEHPSKLP